ncbi:MAG: L,D-transpeptidase family protein, partial [Nitrospirota bacterium]|nr:L,D-transpeptidase family protein [Nitrospirota bacterium]
MKNLLHIAAFLLLICNAGEAATEFFRYDCCGQVIGSVTTYKVKENESLIEIARKFGLGYNEITAANPDLDPFVPGQGASVTIPTSWILPDVESREGIIINLSEMRLYNIYNGGSMLFVQTFPVGIGSEGNDTPAGQFRVIEKIVRPSWHVP